MPSRSNSVMIVAVAAVAIAGCAGMEAPSSGGAKDMTFFVTSANPGKGGNLGGLAGADAHCQKLASAAGAGDRTWRAYLSTQAAALNDPNFVNARDRIGTGPWRNAKGVVVATSVDDLHSPNNRINKDTALDEMGRPVNDRSKTPNMHDMLTGSRPDGTAWAPTFGDMTCANWTSDSKDAKTIVGHHDVSGPIPSGWGVSWNASHPTRGCDPEGLKSTGGAGLYYCFAAK